MPRKSDKPKKAPTRRIGRPQFKPTAKMRNDVAVWKAGGMSNHDIALVLDIDHKTLKKHFDAELTKHWAKKLARVLTARFTAAVKGNVTAQQKFIETGRAVSALAIVEGDTDHVSFADPKRGPPSRKNRIVPIGKKEAAEEAAKTAGLGTEWGDDLVAGTPVQ